MWFLPMAWSVYMFFGQLFVSLNFIFFWANTIYIVGLYSKKNTNKITPTGNDISKYTLWMKEEFAFSSSFAFRRKPLISLAVSGGGIFNFFFFFHSSLLSSALCLFQYVCIQYMLGRVYRQFPTKSCRLRDFKTKSLLLGVHFLTISWV